MRQLIIDAWPDRVLSDGFVHKYLGSHKSRLRANVSLEQSWGEPLIDAIPSETTPAERRVLYILFRHFWSGEGNVFEVGPFLGGTTRAIAMGMEENPNRRADVRIYTADKFFGYYRAEALKSFLHPLIDNGTLTSEDLTAIGSQGEFRRIFERIHRRYPYSSFLEIMDGVLPDLPGSTEGFLQLSAIAPVSAFFIDGCKSWFGTKYLFKQAAVCATPTALFIFQDYGMYTCFWIPLCVYLLRAYFRLLMFTDCTYVWALMCPFSQEDVERAIPDRVEDLDPAFLKKAFEEMLAAARAREDRRALVSYVLQHAAVHAYIGNFETARNMIDDLKSRDESLGYEDLIACARKSPTYRPRLGEPAWENIYLD